MPKLLGVIPFTKLSTGYEIIRLQFFVLKCPTYLNMIGLDTILGERFFMVNNAMTNPCKNGCLNIGAPTISCYHSTWMHSCAILYFIFFVVRSFQSSIWISTPKSKDKNMLLHEVILVVRALIDHNNVSTCSLLFLFVYADTGEGPLDPRCPHSSSFIILPPPETRLIPLSCEISIRRIKPFLSFSSPQTYPTLRTNVVQVHLV